MKPIDETIDELIEEEAIGEESKQSARTVLTWLKNGKKAAEKESEECVKKLQQGGFVSEDGDKLVVESADDFGLILLILGAEGKVERREKE